MADVKISALPAASTPLAGTEILPIVQVGVTEQVSVADLTAGRAISASALTLTTTALAVTSGGTGISSAAQGALLSATGTNTFSATRTPTLGLAGTAAGTLGFSGATSGVVTLQTAATAGTWSLTLPTSGGTNGYILTTNGSGVTSWTNPTALGVDLDVGSTAITGGTTTRVLYNNAGVLGEYAITGTGSVVLGTTPTFTTSALFPAGSVSAPGIAASGNTNTGIYFPAADNAAIATGGVVALTADSSQNVSVTNTLVMGSSFKRNKLINGSMNVYQRGSVAATTAGAYTLDRWFVTPTGATVTVTQSTATVPTNFTASLNVAAAASVTNVSARQRIESLNCQELTSGSKVTVSGYIRQSTGSAVTTATVALVTPTASDNYASTTSAATSYTIPSIATATWTFFSNTFTLTTGCTNGLQITIALGTGLTTGSFNLTGVQLEVGSVATPYERQIYTHQLAECQRYYFRVVNTSTFCGFATGFNSGTTTGEWIIPFPVTMRIAPTALEQTGTPGDYQIRNAAGASDVTGGPTFAAASPNSITINASVTAAVTSGDGSILRNGNNVTAFFGWSAEL